MLLKNQVCLLTGANRGIGAAVLQRFVEEGAMVYATARQAGCLDAVCAELNSSNPGISLPVYLDITDSSAIKTAVMRIKKEQGQLNVLVNNAGIMQDLVLGMINRQTLENTFATNVYAVIDAIQYAAKLMTRQQQGSIINFTSIAAVNGSGGQVAYSASKGAVISLTKSAAKELARFNVRVNAVSPGMIDTDLFHQIGEQAVANASSMIAMGRIGAPQEVADVCVFLASDLSRYVTGQIIGVDGGAVL